MLMTRTICSTRFGTLSRSIVMTSSSPSPAPVRLSPEWERPWPCCLPKKMQSHSLALLSSSTAETSRSTLPLEVSQPKPVFMRFSMADCGRSTTAPLSIWKAALMRLGASGITVRTKFPMTGSRMSMKCRPSWAGTCTRRKNHPSPLRISAPMRSTSSSLFSSSKQATCLSGVSCRRVNLPLSASRRCPPLAAARTNVTRATCVWTFSRCTHTISSKPYFSPVSSSPECVRPFPRAFRLL
mmetsp:Transcript_56778/g.176079  ORF Transcript_56778/g.176079 Transcript_56778/m.176079 type:complete len:240 (+) Transcript_56778:360-1079(+)